MVPEAWRKNEVTKERRLPTLAAHWNYLESFTKLAMPGPYHWPVEAEFWGVEARYLYFSKAPQVISNMQLKWGQNTQVTKKLGSGVFIEWTLWSALLFCPSWGRYLFTCMGRLRPKS